MGMKRVRRELNPVNGPGEKDYDGTYRTLKNDTNLGKKNEINNPQKVWKNPEWRMFRKNNTLPGRIELLKLKYNLYYPND